MIVVWALEGYMNWWLDQTPAIIGIPAVVISFTALAVVGAALLSSPALLLK